MGDPAVRYVKLTGVLGAALLSITVAACGVEGETATKPAAPTASTSTSAPSSASPTPEVTPVDDVAWANAVALIQASVAEDYDTALAMLEWEVDDTVELDYRSFERLVENKWEWRASFAANTESYVGG